MDVAKHTDLLGLLPSLGYTLKRIGSYYTTAEMDSIRIRDPTRWKRYSTGQGGDAITFLQEFCGMRFPEAVDYLLAYHGRSRDSPDRNQPIPRPKLPPPREKPPFVLPPANPDQRRVFAYLRKRGIAPKVIRAFMEAGLLYEDAQYHNCVFVGRDGSGQPRFASKRGTCDLGGSSFKRDVLGSDKKIGFRLPCGPEIEEAAVFEAPIDFMSFCTLCPEIRSNAVALCGLYSDSLDTYLKDHPHLKAIKLLPDNGEPGIAAAKEMRGRYREAGYEVEIRVPKYGKDWNAQLKYKLMGGLEEVKPSNSKEKPQKKNRQRYGQQLWQECPAELHALSHVLLGQAGRHQRPREESKACANEDTVQQRHPDVKGQSGQSYAQDHAPRPGKPRFRRLSRSMSSPGRDGRRGFISPSVTPIKKAFPPSRAQYPAMIGPNIMTLTIQKGHRQQARIYNCKKTPHNPSTRFCGFLFTYCRPGRNAGAATFTALSEYGD